LIDNEEVHLKKGTFGYRVVHPGIIDGKKNWVNILVGGYGNLITLIFILLVILSFLYGVKEMLTGCSDLAENPCKYCRENPTNINFSLRKVGDLYDGGGKEWGS